MVALIWGAPRAQTRTLYTTSMASLVSTKMPVSTAPSISLAGLSRAYSRLMVPETDKMCMSQHLCCTATSHGLWSRRLELVQSYSHAAGKGQDKRPCCCDF
jgi:hypothetical protein